MVRRLVARTMAQQLSEAVERATSPYQWAFSTRAGCECVAHVLQGITELHPELTIIIDVFCAFDMISRESMMRGWKLGGGSAQDSPGGGRRQGDAMMPLLFAVGQHRALEAIHSRMNVSV